MHSAGTTGAGRILIQQGSISNVAILSVSQHNGKVANERVPVTLDPNEATSFIVPFDLGVHSYIDHMNGFPRLASPHGWMAQALLKEKVSDKNVFLKNRGHDHFVFCPLLPTRWLESVSRPSLCKSARIALQSL